jgi:hypothetical protein
MREAVAKKRELLAVIGAVDVAGPAWSPPLSLPAQFSYGPHLPPKTSETQASDAAGVLCKAQKPVCGAAVEAKLATLAPQIDVLLRDRWHPPPQPPRRAESFRPSRLGASGSVGVSRGG